MRLLRRLGLRMPCRYVIFRRMILNLIRITWNIPVFVIYLLRRQMRWDRRGWIQRPEKLLMPLFWSITTWFVWLITGVSCRRHKLTRPCGRRRCRMTSWKNPLLTWWLTRWGIASVSCTICRPLPLTRWIHYVPHLSLTRMGQLLVSWTTPVLITWLNPETRAYVWPRRIWVYMIVS